VRQIDDFGDPNRNGMLAPTCPIIPSPNGSGQSHRKQQSGCLVEELSFLTIVDLPDELYARAIDEREYIVAEVVSSTLAAIFSGMPAARHSDRAVGAAFPAKSAKKKASTTTDRSFRFIVITH
jgi:hypothetical protein